MSDPNDVVLNDTAKDLLKRRVTSELANMSAKIAAIEVAAASVLAGEVRQSTSSGVLNVLRVLSISLAHAERAFDQALGIATIQPAQIVSQPHQIQSTSQVPGNWAVNEFIRQQGPAPSS